MRKTIFLFLIILIIFGCFLLFSNNILAEDDNILAEDDNILAEETNKPVPIKLTSPIKAETVPQLIGSIVKAILGIVGALALLMFVYGGFLWLTSGGNPDRIKKGKDVLIWATIGLVVIFSSYALVSFVIRALGA